jgi:hypothetical protein
MCDIMLKYESIPTNYWFGVANGALCYCSCDNPKGEPDFYRASMLEHIENDEFFMGALPWKIHQPEFGEAQDQRTYDVDGSQYTREVALPLWVPLSAILGWLVFRELRWQEKRAKSKELP